MNRLIVMCMMLLVLTGCATRLHRLSSRDVEALRQGSTAVIYVDPVKPLTILRYDTATAKESGGGLAGDIAAGVNAYASANGIEYYMALHQAEIDKFDVLDGNYEAIRADFAAIPSLQNASWQRLSALELGPSIDDRARATGADFVVLIEPQALIYANADPLAIRCQVSLYAVRQGHVRRAAYDRIDAVAPLGPEGSDSLPNPFFHNQYLVKGDELYQRVEAIFADDGVKFQGAYRLAHERLKTLLWSYFTGNLPPETP